MQSNISKQASQQPAKNWEGKMDEQLSERMDGQKDIMMGGREEGRKKGRKN